MGNAAGSEKRSDEEFTDYLGTLTLVRKEHSEELGRDIDLYRPNFSEFEEDMVLLVEMAFDEAETASAEFVDRFKSEVNMRKNFNCRNLTQLLFVNYKVFSGLCVEKLLCRVALEFSEQTLTRSINDSRGVRASMTGSDIPSPAQVTHFLTGPMEALLCLKRYGRKHGFIQPGVVLVYNKESAKPLYKLVDVTLVSRHPKFVKQRLRADDQGKGLLRAARPRLADRLRARHARSDLRGGERHVGAGWA